MSRRQSISNSTSSSIESIRYRVSLSKKICYGDSKCLLATIKCPCKIFVWSVDRQKSTMVHTYTFMMPCFVKLCLLLKCIFKVLLKLWKISWKNTTKKKFWCHVTQHKSSTPDIFCSENLQNIFLICETRIEIETNRLLLHSYIKQILYYFLSVSPEHRQHRHNNGKVAANGRYTYAAPPSIYALTRGKLSIFFFCKDKQFQSCLILWCDGKDTLRMCESEGRCLASQLDCIKTIATPSYWLLFHACRRQKINHWTKNLGIWISNFGSAHKRKEPPPHSIKCSEEW